MHRVCGQAIVVLAAIGAGAAVSHHVSGSMAVATQPADQPAAPPQQDGGAAGMGQILINSLKTVDGCLGVDAGQMASGKNSIFAWFEDAEAARRWYNHPTHRAMLGMAGGRSDDSKPLAHVEEGVPLMVIASLTFSDTPGIEGIPMPISQISIEVYRAAPGGAYINGKLAPESFTVEHMKNLTTPAEE